MEIIIGRVITVPTVIVTVENDDSFYFPSPLSQWMKISLLASWCD